MLMVEVVLRNPKMAIAILAQGESLDTRESCLETSPQTSQARSCMQDEEDPVVPRTCLIHTVINVDTLVVP